MWVLYLLSLDHSEYHEHSAKYVFFIKYAHVLCGSCDSDLQMCVPYLWWGKCLEGLDDRAVVCTGCCASFMLSLDFNFFGVGCRFFQGVCFVLWCFDGDLELSSDGECHSVLSLGSVS